MRTLALSLAAAPVQSLDFSQDPYRLQGLLRLSSGAWGADFDGKADDTTVLAGGVYLVEVLSEKPGEASVRTQKLLTLAPEGSSPTLSLVAAPNPARGKAVLIAWQPSSAVPQVRIYSLSGELVRDLGPQPASPALWDLKDGGGASVAGGLYLVVAGLPGERPRQVLKVAVVR